MHQNQEPSGPSQLRGRRPGKIRCRAIRFRTGASDTAAAQGTAVVAVLPTRIVGTKSGGWIISDETSIKGLTNPSAQIPMGGLPVGTR